MFTPSSLTRIAAAVTLFASSLIAGQVSIRHQAASGTWKVVASDAVLAQGPGPKARWDCTTLAPGAVATLDATTPGALEFFLVDDNLVGCLLTVATGTDGTSTLEARPVLFPGYLPSAVRRLPGDATNAHLQIHAGTFTSSYLGVPMLPPPFPLGALPVAQAGPMPQAPTGSGLALPAPAIPLEASPMAPGKDESKREEGKRPLTRRSLQSQASSSSSSSSTTLGSPDILEADFAHCSSRPPAKQGRPGRLAGTPRGILERPADDASTTSSTTSCTVPAPATPIPGDAVLAVQVRIQDLVEFNRVADGAMTLLRAQRKMVTAYKETGSTHLTPFRDVRRGMRFSLGLMERHLQEGLTACAACPDLYLRPDLASRLRSHLEEVASMSKALAHAEKADRPC